jgi:hypothetical protein
MRNGCSVTTSTQGRAGRLSRCDRTGLALWTGVVILVLLMVLASGHPPDTSGTDASAAAKPPGTETPTAAGE